MIARHGCYFQGSVRRERSWISRGIHPPPPATGSLQPEAIGAACPLACPLGSVPWGQT